MGGGGGVEWWGSISHQGRKGGGQWWRRGGDLHERERDLFFRTTNLDTGGADGENAEEDHGSAFDDRGSGEVGQRY